MHERHRGRQRCLRPASSDSDRGTRRPGSCPGLRETFSSATAGFKWNRTPGLCPSPDQARTTSGKVSPMIMHPTATVANPTTD